jgi:hypothetical protein
VPLAYNLKNRHTFKYIDILWTCAYYTLGNPRGKATSLAMCVNNCHSELWGYNWWLMAKHEILKHKRETCCFILVEAITSRRAHAR